MVKKANFVIQVRQEQGAGCIGLLPVLAKTGAEIGNKNTEYGKTPEHIHKDLSFFGLNWG